MENDPEPIIKYVEEVIPDKKAGESLVQLFRILSFALMKKKSGLKKELYGMTQTLMKNLNEDFYKVFRLLNDLREADVSQLLLESSKLNPGDE